MTKLKALVNNECRDLSSFIQWLNNFNIEKFLSFKQEVNVSIQVHYPHLSIMVSRPLNIGHKGLGNEKD